MLVKCVHVLIYSCCNGIVVENTRRRQTNMEDNADHELKDLKRLRVRLEAALS